MRLKYFLNQLCFNLRSKLYRKYLISYLAVFLIPVVVLMGINVMIYHNSLKTSMSEIGRESTAKFKMICDDVLSRANRMVYNISGTSSVIRALKRGDVEMAIESQSIIDSLLVTDDVITDAFIYSDTNKRVYMKASSISLNSFLYQESDPKSRELVKNVITSPDDSISLIKASNTHMEKGALVYTVNQKRSDGMWYNILFLIDKDYVINAMNHTECVGAIVYDGNVIISNDDGNIEILKLDERKNYRRNGVKYTLYSEKSDYADITYLMLVPESAVIKNLAGINLAILLVLVIWGAVMIVFLANASYNPIKSITKSAMDVLGVEKSEKADSFSFINDAIAKIGKQSKEYGAMHDKLRFMQQLINGDYDSGGAHEFLTGTRYNVFTIKAMSRKKELAVDLNKYTPYIEKNFLADDDCLLGIVGGNICIILLCDDSGRARDKADLCYDNLCRNIDGMVTAGLGMSYTADKLSYSYSEAMVSSEYSSVAGCLVYYENINGLEDITAYPTINIERIKNLLSSGKIDEVNEEIRLTIAEMISCKRPIFLVKCVCYELVSVIIREIDKLSVGSEKISIDINSIMKIDNLHHLIQFVENMSYMYRNSYEEAINRKKNTLIHDIEVYIKEHFCDNDFYVNKIADEFGISVSNLSKQFRKYKNCNITQYVTMLQMERAKELLKTTDYSMSVIANMVGQQDVSNFIRKFKAHEKVTPGEYRKSVK